ncbi:MAG: glutathione S-transferase family protein [Pseudomonadota bacterium]
MKLEPTEIETKEVLQWQGLHLLNYAQSSCSQKVRILLGEKGVPYTSREIDIKNAAHTTPWYLGINRRGVVPVLVHDGEVHIESNDILRYIDKTFPTKDHKWVPDDGEHKDLTDRLLALEAELHLHLRVVTMGYLLPHSVARKSEAELEAYARNGTEDPHRAAQIEWWRAFGEHGVTDAQSRQAVESFQIAFNELEDLLGDKKWLLGNKPTVIDIAWFISLHRIALAGYPLQEHPKLHKLYTRMKRRPVFKRELAKGPAILQIAGPVYRLIRRLKGTSLKSAFDQIQFNQNATREGLTT